ncbi:ABC transporter substrate-binding protein [Nocardioides sp.]|uniref:ABC transporter substrate-binding protein n=1 Tax=Nocardioides sp. TaxID=35761 RepID=UPI002620BD0F|nr:ABC transporter substrate-binding protein [Nocardioides sp.]
MPKRTPLLALVATVTAIAVTACGGAPGAEEGGSSSDNSDAASAAAEVLGIDLAECPADVTDPLPAEANVGLTLPLTGGPATAFAVLGPGAEAALEQANAEAGLDTKFNLIQKDDQFLPDKTVAAVQELIQQDEVVAMTGVTGTAAVLAIRDLLKRDCIPGVSLPGGGAGAADPDYPEVVQGATPFSLDARIWVESVNEQFPDGAKIATFIGNTESGNDYALQIDRWLEETDSKSEIVSAETIEAADAAAPSSQVTTMRNSDADVLFAAPTGAQCISVLTEAANQGWKPVTYLTTNCGSSTYLGATGPAGEGVLVVQPFKDINSPRFADDEGVAEVRAALEKYSPDADLENTTTYSGYTYAEALVEAARAAADSELGLSRLGIIVAARQLDFHSPMLVDGVDFTVDGLEDMVPIEAAELNAWSVDEGGFVQGELYDFEGQLTEQ